MMGINDEMDRLLDEDLLKRIHSGIYKKVGELQMHAWCTQEPLPFDRRFEGEPIEPRVGESWGRALFDCAWFHFTANIPDCDAELVARIDINGELLVVDCEGIALRGLTNTRSVFSRDLGEPGKIIMPIPQDQIQMGKLSLWADAGFNDLFGSLQNQGRIEVADVCVVREDVRALYYDVEVIVDYAKTKWVEAKLKEQMLESLEGVHAITRESLDPDAISRSRDLLSPFFQGNIDRSFTVSATGHAHLDLAWLWPIRETIRKGARTLSTVFSNLDTYPDYVFGLSQPQLHAWMKEYYPEIYQRLKDRVGKGRIEPQGTFWVEPDCNLPSGESTIRQVIYGSRFFLEEYGVLPTHCWEPDVFGYNGQLPQILKKCGHDVFMTMKLSWNVVNKFPYQSFNWQGIDGTEILVHMLPEETYNGPAMPHSVLKIRNEYTERDVSKNALMLFGIGDGGGGPGREHLERIGRLQKLNGMPEIKIRQSHEFFGELKAEAAALPTWRGELYLERHQGTFTTQALVKKYNRQCELLLREVEYHATLASILAEASYPVEQLEAIWKEVLLYQFHDILPGSSIRRVYTEAIPRYEALIAELGEMLKTALESLVVESEISPSAGARLAVSNSLGFSRNEWVKHAEAWYRVSMPASSIAYVEPSDSGAPCSSEMEADSRVLENEHLRVEFSEEGTIGSIKNLDNGFEHIPNGKCANRLYSVSDKGDAWDFETDHPNKDVWLYLKKPREYAQLKEMTKRVDGPYQIATLTFTIGKRSTIKQVIRIGSGMDIVEFDTVVDWQEKEAMLRVEFPVKASSEHALFEIPFGSIARSTHERDSVSKAQLEVPAQQWVDYSDEDCGLALLNDCKYGYRVKDQVIDMTLIRSVPYPNNALVTVDDTSSVADSNAEYTDLGRHNFRYALYPHMGPSDEASITARARAFNAPVDVISCLRVPLLEEQAAVAFIDAGSDSIDLSSLKIAESDRSAFILRLANVSPKALEAELRLKLPHHCAFECDMLENDIERLEATESDRYCIRYAPFEVKTFKFSFD